MAIRVAYPTDKRRPGAGAEFDFTANSQSLVPAGRSVLCIGIGKGGTQAAGKPVQVYSDSDAETYFGVGTEVTLMARKALEVGRLHGSAPEVWAIGIDELVGGTAATSTITLTGPAAAGGDLVLRIAGRTVRAPVTSGDTAATVATALKAAIDRIARDLPVTAAVAGAVVTLTARAKGLHGNEAALATVSAPSGISVALVQPTAGAGVVSIVAALAAALTRDYYAVAIGNHATQDITDWGTHAASAWATMAKRFRYAFVGERGALATAQTLSAAANSERVIVVNCPSSPSPSYEIAAAAAAAAMVHENPAHNRNGMTLPLYPPDLDLALSDGQIETALASGITPLTPDVTGQRLKIERLVTTKTTVSGAPFEGLLDFGNSWAVARFAREMDPIFGRMLEGKSLDDGLLADLLATAKRALRRRAQSGWFIDVEALIAQVKVERDPVVSTRALLELPERVTPIANQVIVKHNLYT